MELNNNNTPVIYEADMLLGSIVPPNGHIILRFIDGRHYIGNVKNGRPHGVGISTGFYWIYEGMWLDGILIQGVMRHIYTREVITIPSVDTPL